MLCDKARKLYEEALDVRNPEPEEALQHMRACDDCGRWLAAMRATSDALQADVDVSGLSVAQAVMAVLPQRHPAAAGSRARRSTILGAGIGMAAAAAALMATMIASMNWQFIVGSAVGLAVKALELPAILKDAVVALRPLVWALADLAAAFSAVLSLPQVEVGFAATCLLLIIIPLIAGKRSGIKMRSFVCCLSVLVVLLGASGARAADIPPESVDLPTAWRFHVDPDGTGYSKGWHKVAAPSGQWRMLKVPGDWESQGVTDVSGQPYDGYAWYRTSVVIPAGYKGRDVYLNLGKIDDQDWAWMNGILVGQTTSASTPTDHIVRSYIVPPEAIRYGQVNLIAVRVRDLRLAGGILYGKPAVSLDAPQTEVYTGKGKERVRVGGGIVVKKGETLSEVVSVLGDVVVRGNVTGDAVAVVGRIIVEEGGRVGGDAVSVVGGVTERPGGVIEGDTVQVTPGLGANPALDGRLGAVSGLLGVWGWLQATVFSLLLTLMFPTRIATAAESVVARPAASFGYGALGLSVGLLALLMLAITCIGIPLALLGLLGMMVLFIGGSAAVRVAAGDRLFDSFGRRGISPILAVVVGAALFGLVRMVPVAGVLAVLIADLLGLGAILITGFGAAPNWLADRNKPAAPPPTPVPPAQQPPPPGNP